uniref:Uncharacterized protein n=1 Tax=uncultured bacterium HF770_09N20 TaxID=710816 RepID=E0XPU5_9BACT|nr:hypothetical protein [uncultured bacterium HF770_09N20]
MDPHYALILRFGGWKFFVPSKCATLGLRLDLKFALHNRLILRCKIIISGLEVSGNPFFYVRQSRILR